MACSVFKRRAKYGNRRVLVDGMRFDSEKEYQRWCELKLLEKAGEIKNLRRQVEYTLVPSQKGGGRTERPVKYKADLVYERNGETVVEDVKGVRTKEYIIKRKLMRYIHGIVIHEV